MYGIMEVSTEISKGSLAMYDRTEILQASFQGEIDEPVRVKPEVQRKLTGIKYTRNVNVY